MIVQIARKDFLANILSARFLIGFVFCLVLIPFSILLNISSYRGRMNQFRIDSESAAKDTRQVRVYSGLRPEIVIPPEALSIFSKGISDQVGNRVKIQLGDTPMLAQGKTAAGDNPFLASFLSVDFVDIAAIIFSLLALIFSYDAFTREKEDGTLKLQMSNSLGRSACLAGKVLGIVFTLMPILIFSFVLSAVLILLTRGVSFSAVEWGRITLLFAVSLLYLAVFVFIGLFVSARSKTSVTSLVLCLFLWVFFVFLVPNVSANFAESYVRVQSRDNLNRVLADLDSEFNKTVKDRMKAASIPGGFSSWRYAGGEDGYVETYGDSREIFDLLRRKAAISEPLRIEYANNRWASQENYLESLVHQAHIAERISWVSPTGIFRAIASAVSATDLGSHESVMDATRRYRETFIRFFQGKKIFASFRWITPTPPETFKAGDELIEKRTGGEFKTEKAFWDWAAKQIDQFSAFRKLSKVKVPGEQPEDFPFLDISDMPRFQVSAKTLFSGLGDSFPSISFLLVECIFLFALGYVAFLRYDVR